MNVSMTKKQANNTLPHKFICNWYLIWLKVGHWFKINEKKIGGFKLFGQKEEEKNLGGNQGRAANKAEAR